MFVCRVPLFAFSLTSLLLPFTKVESQINQLQKDSLGEIYERTLVSDLAILAPKWLKIAKIVLHDDADV